MAWIILWAVMLAMSLFIVAICLRASMEFQDDEGFYYGKENENV